MYLLHQIHHVLGWALARILRCCCVLAPTVTHGSIFPSQIVEPNQSSFRPFRYLAKIRAMAIKVPGFLFSSYEAANFISQIGSVLVSMPSYQRIFDDAVEKMFQSNETVRQGTTYSWIIQREILFICLICRVKESPNSKTKAPC